MNQLPSGIVNTEMEIIILLTRSGIYYTIIHYICEDVVNLNYKSYERGA